MDTKQDRSAFSDFLARQDAAAWRSALDALLPDIHPVDREATRIWFAFWPLRLKEAIEGTSPSDPVITRLELDGKFRLEEQLDDSVAFLFGARYWEEVRANVARHARETTDPEGQGLADQIRKVTGDVAAQTSAPQSEVLGITAVAFMALGQVGPEVFSRPVSPIKTLTGTADQIVRRRQKNRGSGLFGWLHTIDRRHTVTFDEHDAQARFPTIHNQDISLAASSDKRDYQGKDHRRIEGPIPFQCRTASCGMCWIGVLGGRDRLEEISPYERQRLGHFGYDFTNREDETHPPIRLACQARCQGDVTIVIPPWNGVLNVKRSDW